MSDHVPTITVAMPIYNAGKELRLAVLSVLAQTFEDWELLIIDDGSTDDALESLSDIHDKRIHIIRDGSNKGLAARLNQAIDSAQGAFLARMDQDDVCYPDRFAKQIAALQMNPNLDLVAVRTVAISSGNELLGIRPFALSNSEICARPWMGFYLPHPTWMGRLEWFKRYRYAEPAPLFSEDQELLLRSYRDSHFETLPEILLAYRLRDTVNRGRMFRTRIAVFCTQFSYFMRRFQLHFVALATLTVLVRLLADLFNPLAWRYDHGEGASFEELLAKWSFVLNAIRAK